MSILHLLIALQKNPRKKNLQKRRTTLTINLKNWKIVQEKKGKQKTTSNIKQAIINLTDVELTDEQMSLLNLEPNFVPATKRIPAIECQLMSATEKCAIDLENSSKETDFYVKK